MLIRASGPLQPEVFLLTFGDSSHYLVVSDDGSCTLFDPGLSLHVEHLTDRMQQLSLDPSKINQVFLTHLHPERIGGLPLLRKMNPNLQVLGTAAMQRKLVEETLIKEVFEGNKSLCAQYPKAKCNSKISFEEYKEGLKIDRTFPESETFTLGEELSMRWIATPGHSAESVGYLILPYNFLICDETFGFFRGRDLAAPGGDQDLEESVTSIEKFRNIEITALCLPMLGALTGDLVRRHMESVVQNIQDLKRECNGAKKAGVPVQEIRATIRESFYLTTSKDPIHQLVMDRSFEALCRQLITE